MKTPSYMLGVLYGIYFPLTNNKQVLTISIFANLKK